MKLEERLAKIESEWVAVVFDKENEQDSLLDMRRRILLQNLDEVRQEALSEARETALIVIEIDPPEAKDRTRQSSDDISPETLTRWAKKLGEQLDGKIICPSCSLSEEIIEHAMKSEGWTREQAIEERGQKMSTYGDLEDCLFCPHCEIELRLSFLNP